MSPRKHARAPLVPAAQMDWLDALPPQTLDARQALQWLHAWADQGLLRRLDSALAEQLHRLDPQAPAALLVAAAVLAQMEGRGHTCLPLTALCAPPVAVLGWPAAWVEGPMGLNALWAQLPADVSAWREQLQAACLRGMDAPDAGQPLVLGGTPEAPLLYLRRYAGYEQRVGQGLLQRAGERVALDEAAARLWLDRFFAPRSDAALDWQKLACAVALRARLSVITGGPGTGKTYTAARLLAVLLALHEGAGHAAPGARHLAQIAPGAPHLAQTAPGPLRVALAAPTGKAAARLKQSIDKALLELPVPADAGFDLTTLVERMGPARTLHALLGARPDTRQFRHHAAHPLDVDVLIVDEASMVHLEMMDALLQALPPTARLVLLGDKDQLASVEAGAVLGDLCRDAALDQYGADTARLAQAVAGQTMPAAYLAEAEPAPVLAQQTVMLRESRRFGGPIGRLALAVNRGDAAAARAELASHEAGPGPLPLWAVQPSGAEAVCALALGSAGKPSYAAYLAAMQQGPAGEGTEAHAAWVRGVLLAFDRFRILCAVRQGDWGAQGLNAAVQKALAGQGGLRPEGEWFAGRPVMVTRNDAQLGVFNGDVGVVLPDPRGVLKAWFLDGEQLRSVSVMRLAEVETAFVMTVHKSQGSEFEHTVLVLPPGGGELLSRELVYTGITRSREQFTLVEAEAGLLEAAVQRPSVRATGLRLWWG